MEKPCPRLVAPRPRPPRPQPPQPITASSSRGPTASAASSSAASTRHCLIRRVLGSRVLNLPPPASYHRYLVRRDLRVFGRMACLPGRCSPCPRPRRPIRAPSRGRQSPRPQRIIREAPRNGPPNGARHTAILPGRGGTSLGSRRPISPHDLPPGPWQPISRAAAIPRRLSSRATAAHPRSAPWRPSYRAGLSARCAAVSRGGPPSGPWQPMFVASRAGPSAQLPAAARLPGRPQRTNDRWKVRRLQLKSGGSPPLFISSAARITARLSPSPYAPIRREWVHTIFAQVLGFPS